ncbi:MAG TPA: DUF885 domain-containing protein [Acidimicrobiales bacterium]|jgi:uncharacterized protein (DUF885 family)|nr:DUF885 domain-containing protein [Acidimicrobiales bacterium]
MTDHDLRAIAEEYWERLLKASPTFATFVGDHRYDDRIEDLSATYEQQLREHWESLHDRVERIDPAHLSQSEQVTRGLLLAETRDGIEGIDQRLIEFRYDQMQGVAVELLQTVPVLNAPEPDHAWRLVERYRQVPAMLQQAADRYTAGLAAGRTPARICLERTLNVLDGYLASPLDDDPFTKIPGPASWDGDPAWRDALAELARDVVRPAFGVHRATLAERLEPSARDDEHAGLCHLGSDGESVYATLVRHHTTLDLSPQEIHDIGLQEATELLPREYAEVGGRLFGVTELADVFRHLQGDDSLRYGSAEEIVADAHDGIDRARAAMADWFGRLPQAPCNIEPVPDFLAPDSPSAYYFPPAADGSRPGTYFVNTWEPTQKNRYEAASVAYHEAIPGHHLQIAIANELDDVPTFQRQSLSNTAYVEGWGLYAERLADEMGLYLTDLDRIGMLAADSWRACRLVVDTGLHALGWTRQQAIDFMAKYTPVSIEELTVEVDRYIAMPGQALSYKLGQREFFRLRGLAQQQLGDRFDIKGFHDTVLGSGAVSLPILGDLVDGWVRSHAA